MFESVPDRLLYYTISSIPSFKIFKKDPEGFLDRFVFASVIGTAQYHKDDVLVLSFLGNGE